MGVSLEFIISTRLINVPGLAGAVDVQAMQVPEACDLVKLA